MNTGHSEPETNSTRYISRLWAVLALKPRGTVENCWNCGRVWLWSTLLLWNMPNVRNVLTHVTEISNGSAQWRVGQTLHLGSAKSCIEMYRHQGHSAIFDNFSNVTTQAYLLSRLTQAVNRPDFYQEVFGHRIVTALRDCSQCLQENMRIIPSNRPWLFPCSFQFHVRLNIYAAEGRK
jgi:hypothetical protein